MRGCCRAQKSKLSQSFKRHRMPNTLVPCVGRGKGERDGAAVYRHSIESVLGEMVEKLKLGRGRGKDREKERGSLPCVVAAAPPDVPSGVRRSEQEKGAPKITLCPNPEWTTFNGEPNTSSLDAEKCSSVLGAPKPPTTNAGKATAPNASHAPTSSQKIERQDIQKLPTVPGLLQEHPTAPTVSESRDGRIAPARPALSRAPKRSHRRRVLRGCYTNIDFAK